MKIQPINAIALATIAIVALLAIVPSSCQRDRAMTIASSDSDKTHDKAFWADSAYRLNVKATEFFNAGLTDSLEEFVPQAMKTCLEHNEMERYYIIWRLLAEEYVWDDNFEKAVAEAQRIQEDAIERHLDNGLFEAYYVLGVGYAYREYYEEGAKYLRKAISHFHYENVAPLMEAYLHLTQVLNDKGKYETIDSTLAQWKAQIDRRDSLRGSKQKTVWAHWNFLYQLQLAEYLKNTGKLDAAAAALDSVEYYQKLEGNLMLDKLTLIHSRSTLAHKQKDFKTALRYSQQMLDLAIESGDNNSMMNAMVAKVRALEGLNHYKEALLLLHKYKAFKDSVAEISNSEQLNKLNKRFEVNELKMQAEHEHIKAELQQMQAQRRQILLLAAIVLLIFLGTTLFTYYHSRSRRHMARMKAEQERLDGELKIARDIQMSMVPSTFPVYEGLDMYASMAPAKEVGGDLYGYVLLGDRLYFAVGDVSGKGVPASLLMAQTTQLFRTLAAQGMMPAEICTRMNDALAGEENQSGMFVTMFVGLLDLKTGHVDFCNAGHNPPVLTSLTAGGETRFLQMEPNAPFGLWTDLQYVGEEIESIMGKSLFVYTDGLNEAENLQLEQLGDDRILELISNTGYATARQLVETMAAEVAKHRNGAEPSDDLTMMCVSVGCGKK